MKESEALELYKEVRSIISKVENEEERDRLTKLIFCDIDFVTEGSLKEYIKSLAKGEINGEGK